MSKVVLEKNKGYYLLENFADANLICAFSSRPFGNMSLLYGNTRDALTHRRDFLAGLGIDYQNLVCAKQIHGSFARYVKEGDRGRGALSYDTSIADTDALITDKKNLPLTVFTADCLSIFLYDAVRPAIGLVHAGWQGAKENIAAKTLLLMKKEFNTRIEDIYAGFGPAIRGCCYEVGEDLLNLFPDELIKRDGRYYLDLAGINKKQLLNLGVQDANVFDSRICTSCRNEEFFSYRREGSSCGRMMSVLMLNSRPQGSETEKIGLCRPP